jgi:hypothetical protein
MPPQTSLEHQVLRLGQRLERCRGLSRRYSWLRLGLFAFGGLITWAAFSFASRLAGWIALSISLILFSTAVFLHRRLDGWIEKLSLWRDLRLDQLARLNLNWEQIPPSRLPADRTQTALESDLDLTGPHSLHQLVDTAFSRNGSRLLADWLSTPRLDPALVAERQAIVRELVPLERFRDRLQLTFRLVAREQLDGDKLLQWLKEQLPSARLKQALIISTILVLLNLVLFILNQAGRLPAYWIVTLAAYFAFYYFNSQGLEKFMSTLVELNKELGKFKAIFRYLENHSYRKSPHLAALCAPFQDRARRPSLRMRLVNLVTVAVGLRSNPFLGMLLNGLLPWDFACAWLAWRCRDEMARRLPIWLDTCHRLEALVSLAGFGRLNPGYVFPEIVPEAQPVFQAAALGHPLLPPDRRVCNDFSLRESGELAILTGSNMAGKSTFLKAVGVNLCLAAAGGPVNAARFQVAPVRLFTCIHITDSVTDGLSYFYAEVKRLRSLLDELRALDQPPLFYLIDEIFRGTNNRERLIGSRAYVGALLGAPGLGLLATHDLELAGLAENSPQVGNYHFRDEVREGELAFDYMLRPGPCPTTNALKIMAMEGLPVGAEDQSSGDIHAKRTDIKR